MSRTCRRTTRRTNAILLLILAALTVAVIAVGCRSLFRAPDRLLLHI